MTVYWILHIDIINHHFRLFVCLPVAPGDFSVRVISYTGHQGQPLVNAPSHIHMQTFTFIMTVHAAKKFMMAVLTPMIDKFQFMQTLLILTIYL